jgi:hypothetical protein
MKASETAKRMTDFPVNKSLVVNSFHSWIGIARRISNTNMKGDVGNVAWCHLVNFSARYVG